MKRLLSRILAVFQGKSNDVELDEELQSHLEMAISDNRQLGMSEAEARRTALAALGGIPAARESHRDARGLPVLESVWQDLRYSIRTLRRDAGFAIFAILIAGLGVGATATVFSVVHTILVRSLPLGDSGRLAWIANNQGPGLSARTMQVGHLLEMRKATRSFSDIAGYMAFYSPGDLTMTGVGEPERLTCVPVTGNFFPALGVPMALGRQFSNEEELPNGPNAIILSNNFWQRRFNSDPNIIGRKLLFNGEPYTVAGVLPHTFDFGALFVPGQQVDAFQPFPLTEQTNRWGNTLSLVGRLNPGVSVEAALAETKVFADRTSKEHPQWNSFTPLVIPLREHVSGSVRTAMLVLAGAVGLVMLIVCANLSNLLLARATARQKEMSIRAALGAGRGRLIRQMLVESLLLSGAGAALGLVLAAGATRMLSQLDAKIPLLATLGLDSLAVWFTLALALLTGLAFGLIPALRVSSPQGARGATSGKEHTRIRGALVVAEVALACLLLLGSGLLIRSFLRILDVDMGFQPQHALALRIDPGRRFTSKEQQNAYFRDALSRIGSAPGIAQTGLTDALPLGKNRTWGAGELGKTYEQGKYPSAYVRIVSDGYFRTMGIGLVQGRGFTPNDNPASQKVIVINETLAKTLWPGQDPIGKTMQQGGGSKVIGVVRDVRHLALEQESGGEMYLPIWQTGDFQIIDLVVRGNGAQRDIEAVVREQLRAMDPTLPVAAFRPLQEIVDKSVSPRRLIVVLLSAFAGFAVLLASLGIYGVISYSVTQRRKEVGIRMALGASAGAVRWGILAQTLWLTAAGLAIGLLASWALLRFLQGMLFGVTLADPATFGAALLLLTLVAALAGFVPAQRAAKLNPMEALRLD